MQESILITTLDGEVHRFYKNNIDNFDLYKDSNNLNRLLLNNMLEIKLKTRTIYFLTNKIVKIEIIDNKGIAI